MSKSKKNSKETGTNQRELLSLNKGSTMASVATVADESDEGKDNGVKPESKKSVKKITEKKSFEDIFVDTFSIQVDKKGKVKPASISKLDLKTLCSTEEIKDLRPEAVDAICKNAVQSDITLGCLTEIALSIMELSSGSTRDTLFSLCIHIASGVWINKHRGSINLFRDILSDEPTGSDCIQFFENTLSSMYQKRLQAVTKKPIDAVSSVGVDGDEGGHQYTKGTLERQKINLQLIGVLWLLDQGKVELQETVDYLFQWLNESTTSKSTLRDTSLFLSSQILAPEPRFIKVLALLMQKNSESIAQKQRAEALLIEKSRQILRLQEDLSTKQLELEQSLNKIDVCRSDLEGLKKQTEDQQLNERAARTHLRDSEGKVRAKAFNLLSEEVLEPLRLSLAALQRDNPKTESAIHQIELALESIERDIPWFKE